VLRRPHLWFQTVGPLRNDDVPGSATAPVHAKRYGTNATACGVVATNLHKHWDLAFDPFDIVACTECSRAVLDVRPALAEASAS
jgi:hypothetical protein